MSHARAFCIECGKRRSRGAKSQCCAVCDPPRERIVVHKDTAEIGYLRLIRELPIKKLKRPEPKSRAVKPKRIENFDSLRDAFASIGMAQTP